MGLLAKVPPALWFDLGKIALVLGAVLAVVPYLVMAERKICAWMQDRKGPNRVGIFGMGNRLALGQPLADGIKLLFKEDLVPAGADRGLFFAAPVLVLVPPLATLAIVPFGADLMLFGLRIPLQIADLNIGLLYFLALGAFSVYGLALGGWASNNKYSLMGGLRSTAQLISYEVALGLGIVGVALAAGSLSPRDIVLAQGQPLLGIPGLRWNIFLQPVGFLVFLVACFAENNRLPFDLPEAESELVGGYHTEYSGMKFGLFMMAENAEMILLSSLMTTLYLGGWQVPFADPAWIAGGGIPAVLLTIACFVLKVSALLLVFIVTRWSLPRFRYDQLMGLGWKGLIPLGLANCLFAAALSIMVR